MLADLFSEGDGDVSNCKNETSNSNKINMKKPSQPRSEIGFVGLENQGATCYLNSLLQVMYMTPEIRNGIFIIDPVELGSDLIEQHEKELEDNKLKNIVEVNEQKLESIIEMGFAEHKVRKALIATNNGELEQVFQYIDEHDNDPEFNQSISVIKKKKKPKYIPLELQNLFSQLYLLNKLTVSTQGLTTKGFEWQGLDGQVQHDAHELNRLLIAALEKSLKRTKGEHLCQSLYVGTVVNQILCSNCKQLSEREEQFYDLNLQISDCNSLIHSLRQYCCGEVLEGDSLYQCDTCKSKQKALRSSVIRNIPPILTFSCNRFKIDKSTNWMRVKLTSRWEFPLLINMNPFSEKNSEINEAQHPKDIEDEFVNNLEKESIKICDIIEKTKAIALNLINKYDSNIRLGSLSEEEKNDICSEVYKSVDFYNIMKKSKNNYILHAVIIHRGSAYSGHYYAYIRDNLGEGRWSLSSKGDSEQNINISNLKSSSTENKKVESTNINYFIDTQKKVVVINQHSPEGMIVSAMTSYQSSVTSNSTTSRKRAKFNHSKLSASVENIKRFLNQNKGTNWDETYLASCGAIDSYIKCFPDLFTCNDSTVTVKHENINMISSNEEYKNLLNVFTESLTGGSNDCEINSVVSIEQDEDLARSIQSQINNSEKIEIVDKENENSDQWEVAGNKKKEKKAKSDVATKSSSRNKQQSTKSARDVIDLTIENNDPVNVNSSSEEEKLNELTNELINLCFGEYFEFNDSVISPLPISSLEKSFEGENCAYLLVYRKIRPNEILIRNDPKLPVIPPTFWKEKIDILNFEMENERVIFEKFCSEVSLTLFCPIHLQLDSFPSPLLIQNTNDKDKSSLPDDIKDFISLSTTTKMTLGDILSEILKLYKPCCSKLFIGCDLNKLTFGLLTKSFHGYYVSKNNLKRSDCITEFINNNNSSNLIIWDGSKIGGSVAFYGLLNEPVFSRVSLVEILKTTKKSVNRVNVIQCLDPFLAFGTMRLINICLSLSNKFGIDPRKCEINLIFNTKRMKKTIHNSFIAVQLYDKGVITEKNLLNSSLMRSNKDNLNAKIHSETYIGEILGCLLMETDEVEIVVENILSRGLLTGSIAEALVIQKNNEITVYVDLDFVPLEEERLTTEYEDSEGFSKKITIARNSTVNELKEIILQKFGLVPTLNDNTNIRLGPDVGVNIISNENLSLVEALIQHNATIRMEKGSKIFIQQDEITIKFVLVEKNSPDFKYTNQLQHGRRLEEFSLLINKSESIRSIKDMAGVNLLSYQSGWSINNGNNDMMPMQYRLRRTNWALECEDIMLEENDKGNMITVQELSLKDGDTLLLEEGPVPIKGQYKIEFFAWKNSSWEKLIDNNNNNDNDNDNNNNNNNNNDNSNEVEMTDNSSNNKISDDSNMIKFGELSIMSDDSLLNLHNLCHKLLLEFLNNNNNNECDSNSNNKEEIKSIPSDNILLREFRSDSLPGRSFWIHESSSIQSSTDISNIGKKNSSQVNVKKVNDLTIKKSGILGPSGNNNNIKLIVEALEDHQSKVRLGPGSLRIWVQTLLNPGAAEGEALFDPLWPPIEVTINVGVIPSTGHLKRSICKVFPEIEFDRMSVYKYKPQSCIWTVIKPSSSVVSDRKAKPSENILLKPYCVKEGDQFCVYNNQSSSSNNNYPDIKIASVKNLENRTQRQLMKSKKEYNINNTDQVNRKETMLSIGGTDSYSDEEDD